MVSSVSCYTDGETTDMVVVMRLKMPVDKWTISIGVRRHIVCMVGRLQDVIYIIRSYARKTQSGYGRALVDVVKRHLSNTIN
jgi:hypothetical protein